LAATTGLALVVVLQTDWGQQIFYEPMDSCLSLFINPEHSIAHLFNTWCWLCILDIITFIFASTAVMLADVNGLDGGIVMVPLLVALAAVIAYMFLIGSARGCTSDKVSTRMFVVDKWISLGFLAGLLVVIYLFAVTVIILDR
jgi:hypothetical protein